MKWQDASTNYNGKMLKTTIRLDEKNILEVSLYYSTEYEQIKNTYGVAYNKPTGFETARLNVTKMIQRNPGMYSGGLGKTTTVSQPVKRKTIKMLQDIAEKLTELDIKANNVDQTTEASFVI
jgi:hypothetical protein